MVPKLRFKEFNEKWSTATMAEIYSKIRNGFVGTAREGANKQVISSQADSLIKISRIWADF
ncbi:hypothetical protein, partial [Klebsiella pneumoniae]|uniref:hypothetical protein n=1 Tax=Klebsiella pneumoniae TaxID=573 RepID=UPI000E1FED73